MSIIILLTMLIKNFLRGYFDRKFTKIKISCNDCSNDQYFDYETLRSMTDSEVNLANLNLIIDSFNCNRCGSLNLSIFDIDDRMLFDRGNEHIV